MTNFFLKIADFFCSSGNWQCCTSFWKETAQSFRPPLKLVNANVVLNIQSSTTASSFIPERREKLLLRWFLLVGSFLSLLLLHKQTHKARPSPFLMAFSRHFCKFSQVSKPLFFLAKIY